MILLLAGTSDARALAVELKKADMELVTTVVTESGAAAIREEGIEVLVGRLTAAEMVRVIKGRQVKLLIDASHPFAEEASKNAISAAKDANIPYIRYERENQAYTHESITEVNNYEEAAKLAALKKGVIMLTTGGKTLEIFARELLPLEDTRVLVRLLPRIDNMEKCEALAFPQKNIIAIQGPFSKAFNQALYQQYNVTVMITKESGKAGAVDEKVEAALELGIDIIMIKRPSIQYGTQFSQIEELIQQVEKERSRWTFEQNLNH